ncbi:MAG: AAA family ATPase, partial [Chloroflexi bacterium]|nr:AAA family ATPase [Chloroflexota bacterium]
AVRGYLCALARTGPTVIVFDDLHWADVASLDLLSRVVDLVESRPLLIVCLSRADHDAPSWPVVTRLRATLGAAYTDIDLEPLDAEQAQDLLAHLLHIEDLPASVRALILSTSEGNPFYLEELIRSLIDSRHIVRENGHWRATREIATVALPDTLSGVLSARIDRLPDEPKRVVQAAAVLGRIFGYRTLKAMCATAPPAERIEAVAAHLDTLTREELLRERARDPELEYIFKHALTQQTAYDLLLLRRRKELHRRAGETLAYLYPERHSELAPMLAHHFWLGEDWPRAAEHALRAGGRAVTMHALREAFEHYERAITALERQPEAPASQIVAATLAWTWVAYKQRRHDDETHRAEMLARLARAEALARTQSDTSALAQVLIWTANVNLLSGFPGRAFAYLSEGYRLAMELGEDRLCIVPMFLSTFSMVDTDPRGAVERLDQVIALTQTYANPEVEAHAQGMKALAHARLGEFATARAAIVAAEDRVSASLSTVNQADVNVSIGQAYIDMGEIERGLALTRRGAEVSASVGGLECACAGQIFTGLGYLRQPDLPQAQAALEEALRLVEHTSELAAAMLKPGAEAGLAIARFAATQQPEAIQEMEQLLAAAQGPDDAFVAAFLNLALAQAHTRLGAYDRAEGHLGHSVAFYRRTGMRPYLMMTLEAGAVLYEAQGRATEAGQTRAEAERLRHELW